MVWDEFESQPVGFENSDHLVQFEEALIYMVPPRAPKLICPRKTMALGPKKMNGMNPNRVMH